MYKLIFKLIYKRLMSVNAFLEIFHLFTYQNEL